MSAASFTPSTGLLGLSLLLGAPVLGVGVFFLRQRLREGAARPASPSQSLGCVGILAGAALFSVVGPPVLRSVPGLAIVVGSAFLLRAMTLLPGRGRLARSRLRLLLGVSLYWLLYWTHATAMAQPSKEGVGAIRVDSVIFFPLLFLVGAAGLWLSFDRWSKDPAGTVGPGR